MSEIIFGNTTDFGIRYVPGWNLEEDRLPIGNLHLILGGQLIGDNDESCLIGTWMYRMERILSVLENDVDKLFHSEFENRSDEEIFELIFKSNQLPEEFHPDFLHLPTLPPKVWQYCYVGLDETSDAYLIGMICKSDEMKFLWALPTLHCDSLIANFVRLGRFLCVQTVK